MQQDRAVARLPGAVNTTGPGGDMPEQAAPPVALDDGAKAAIVVRLLLNEGTDLPLEELPEDLQEKLIQRMGDMRLVDRDTTVRVAQEFATILDGVGLSFAGGLAGALSALDGRISPQTAQRLRKEAGVRQTGDPWDRLQALPVEDLAAMAATESTEVAAVLLSKLETARAAELLAHLPGPLARRITYAVSQTGAVTPDAVYRIGMSLASQLDDKPIPAFDQAPGERLGAILNQSASATRDEMLSALDETDAAFAGVVRRAIFTFAHIPARLNSRDAAAVVRAVEPATMLTALAGATEEGDRAAAEFLLNNISSRMADNLREEMTERGAVPAAEADAAMTAVATAIRGLVREGAIALRREDEDESSS